MMHMTLRQRTVGLLASVFGLASVALGAFGAHGLQGRLSPADLEIFQTGVRYQFFHALALLALAARLGPGGCRSPRLAAWAWVVGIVLFSGSLYLLVLTGHRWFGAVTPLGGVAFLVGWCALAWSFIVDGDEDKAQGSPMKAK